VKSVVIYASRYGNTKHVAEAIADALRSRGTVDLLPADETSVIPTEGVDLIVLGGPTEVHSMTAPISGLLHRMPPGSLDGKAVAVFDTRIHGARLFTGSAAASATRRLRGLGAEIVVPPESFFVAGKENPKTGEHVNLETGELNRAKDWATTLADALTAKPASVLAQAAKAQ
jgi:flavodoxin